MRCRSIERSAFDLECVCITEVIEKSRCVGGVSVRVSYIFRIKCEP